MLDVRCDMVTSDALVPPRHERTLLDMHALLDCEFTSIKNAYACSRPSSAVLGMNFAFP